MSLLGSLVSNVCKESGSAVSSVVLQTGGHALILIMMIVIKMSAALKMHAKLPGSNRLRRHLGS